MSFVNVIKTIKIHSVGNSPAVPVQQQQKTPSSSWQSQSGKLQSSAIKWLQRIKPLSL